MAVTTMDSAHGTVWRDQKGRGFRWRIATRNLQLTCLEFFKSRERAVADASAHADRFGLSIRNRHVMEGGR